jgi:ribosomal subunit interface protein
MNKRFTFRNMDHSDAIQNYAEEQLVKIEEFLSNEREPIYLDLVFEPSKTHAHHRVEMHIKTPHYSKNSDYEGPEFYRVLERVIDTMYRELCEQKRRNIDKLKEAGRHDELKKIR